MSVILRQTARTELARSMFRDIQNAYDYYYFGFGKVDAWPDEESPETPVDSDGYMADFRKNLLFVKKVAATDVCLLARRIDWVSGTTYDAYDDDYSSSNSASSGATTLAQANFYVLTSDFNVYKCLDNNNGTASTIMPTGQSTTPFTNDGAGQDGYTWQFMFQLSAADQTKFLDHEYMPVRKVSGNPEFDVNGQLDAIELDTVGANYTEAPTVTITGDGTGATATATISAGAVDAVTITNAGSGYSFAIITFTGGKATPSDPEPTQATATPSLQAPDTAPVAQTNVETTAANVLGTVDRVVVSNVGQDYTTGDVSVEIRGDGTGATATPVVNNINGAITSIEVTARGQGYTFAEVVISQINGVGTNCVARAIVGPPHGHGGHAPRELFAKNLAVVSSIVGDEDPDYMLNNDFRQIALLKNINGSDGSIYTTNTGQCSYIVTVDTADAALLSVDEVVTTDANGRFIVANIDGSTLYLVPVLPIITISSNLVKADGTTMGINSLTTPEIDPASGRIIYLENRTGIVRSTDQVETVKAIFNF